MIFIRLFFILCLIGILIAKYGTPELGLSALLISYYVLGASFYAVNIPVRSAFVKELFGNEAYARVNSFLEIENQVAAVVTGLAAILVLDRFGLDSLVLANIACLVLAALSTAAIEPWCKLGVDA